MNSPGFLAILAAVALTFVHRVVGGRYLREYVAAYARLPDWGWMVNRDPDPVVERWRIRRIAVIVPELTLLLVGLILILTGH